MIPPYVGGSRIDSAINTIFGNIVSADYAHNKIHLGRHYEVSEVVFLGSGASRDYLISTAGNFAHLLIDLVSALDISYTLYEGTTYSGGTALAAVNNNRASANIASVAVSHSPVAGALGTSLITTRTGSSGGGGQAPGSQRGENEFVLNINTDYLLRITSNANNNYSSLIMAWYESA